MYHVYLEYSPAYVDTHKSLPRILFVKTITTNYLSRYVFSLYGFLLAEPVVYKELSHLKDLHTPKFYWAEKSAITMSFMIVVEDLVEAGFYNGSTGSASIIEINTLIRNVAEIHAAWWNNPKLKSDFKPHMNSFVDTYENAHIIISMARKFAYKKHSHLIPNKKVGELWELAYENHFFLSSLMCEGPFTLVHGDARTDNTFFKLQTTTSEENHTNPTTSTLLAKCVFIDWQCTKVGNGLYDIAYMMLYELCPEDRRKYQYEILQIYYDTLIKNGVTSYSYDKCKQQFIVAMLNLSLISLGIIGVYDTVQGDATRKFLRQAIQNFAAIAEDFDLLTLFKKHGGTEEKQKN